jgi:hypothetical protein
MYKRIGQVALILLFLALAWWLPQQLAPPPAHAATVVGYQTVTLFDGQTAYTTTTASSGYIAGSFGEVILQVHSVISGSGYITVTPQFSNQPGSCGAVTNWAAATVATHYVISEAVGLEFGVVPIYVTLADDAATLLRLPTAGRCLRVNIETTRTITPTLYVWMVNTQ